MRNPWRLAIPLIALAGTAAAQGPACKNRIFVDSVFAVQTDKGYDYFLQLRNDTGTRLRADISFNGFTGKRVTLTSTQLRAIPLAARQSQKLKFGAGTNNAITTDAVRILYDLPPTSDTPSLSVTNCR